MIFRSSQISSLLAGLTGEPFQHVSYTDRPVGAQGGADGLTWSWAAWSDSRSLSGTRWRPWEQAAWTELRTQTDQSEGGPADHVASSSLTCHVTSPLVALEVDMSAGLSQVLCCLSLLHLPQLLLRVFPQEINPWTGYYPSAKALGVVKGSVKKLATAQTSLSSLASAI